MSSQSSAKAQLNEAVKASKAMAPPETEFVTFDDQQIFQYDLQLATTKPAMMNKSLKKQIFNAFQKHIFPDTLPNNVVQLNSASFMTIKAEPKLEQKIMLQMHAPAESRGTGKLLPPGPEFVKISRGRDLEGKNVKQWIKFDKFEKVDAKKLYETINNLTVSTASDESAKQITTTSTDENPTNIDVDAETMTQYVNAARSQLLKASDTFASHYHDTILVLAKRTRISISSLHDLNSWSAERERSLLAQLTNAWLHKDTQQKNGIVLGNRGFAGPSIKTECGLEFRKGYRVKPALFHGAGPKMMKVPCQQYFFGSTQVSSFMSQYFGPSIEGCDATKALEATKLLKGVAVKVATLKRTTPCYIYGITHRTVHGITVDTVGYSNTITLAQLYNDKYGRPLKHEKMPCINLGSEGRDFFVPAEACKIVDSQSFSHKVPLYVSESHFDKQTMKTTTGPDNNFKNSPSGDPFPTVEPQQLDLVFAEVVAIPATSRLKESEKHHLVTPAQWSKFKTEICARFNGKLASASRSNQTVDLPHLAQDPAASLEIWREKLHEALNTSQAKPETTFLIVAIPADGANGEMYKQLKHMCDIELGCQSKIIRAHTLITNVEHPREDHLLKFTGSIVRNIFARTLHPSVSAIQELGSPSMLDRFPEYEGAEARHKKLLLAVHVKPLNSFVYKTSLQRQHIKLDTYYLVTVVSSPTSLKRRVHSTHHVVSTANGSALNTEVNAALLAHFQDCPANGYDDLSHIVCYRSDEAAADSLELTKEDHDFKFLLPNCPAAERAVISFVPDTLTMLLKGSAPIQQQEYNCLLREKAVSSNLADDERKDNMQVWTKGQGHVLLDEVGVTEHFMADPYGANREFLHTFSRSKQQIEQATMTYNITYCYKLDDTIVANNTLKVTEADKQKLHQYEHNNFQRRLTHEADSAYFFHALLKNTAMPDILFLAQEASKYVQRYVAEVTDSRDKAATFHGHAMEFKVLEVADGLRKMLCSV